MKYRMIDLFAGIGGIRLGFERAFGSDAETVFISEIDDHAKTTYAENFPDSPPIAGDITKIAAENVPPFDICLAGFPCQAFSIAGRREGFDDDYHGNFRGKLFLDVVRICDYHKPKIIFCENVKGLVNIDKGRMFKTICAAFEKIGYKIFHAVLNSRNFGLAQNRERIYIICFRNDIAPEKFFFPTAIDDSATLADVLDYAPIPSKYYLSETYLETLRRHKNRHEAAGHGFGYEIRDLNGVANALVCGGMGREKNLIVDAREHSTVPTTKIHGAINNENIRKLTPREWARLQGFPENFRLILSDTQLYKQFGNSVSVNVIEAIADAIRSVLEPMNGNKGEWSELYALLKILADGAVNVEVDGQIYRMPVVRVVRQDKSGCRAELRRAVKENFVEVYQNGDRIKKIPAADFAEMANKILLGIINGEGSFKIHGAKEILSTLGLQNIKTQSNKKADIGLSVYYPWGNFDTPVGYSIKSDLGEPPTLFNASQATNFAFKAFGVDDELMREINTINGGKKIRKRVREIERLEFDSVINPTFASNLRLIDTHMDKILSMMLRLYYHSGIKDCAELATELERHDPLKVRVENFYRFRIKKFLSAAALALYPSKPWDGRYEASGGCLVVTKRAELVILPLYNRDDLETYLLNNTRLDTPSPDRHKFGTVYSKVNWGGVTEYFIDLNLQIRFK